MFRHVPICTLGLCDLEGKVGRELLLVCGGQDFGVCLRILWLVQGRKDRGAGEEKCSRCRRRTFFYVRQKAMSVRVRAVGRTIGSELLCASGWRTRLYRIVEIPLH